MRNSNQENNKFFRGAYKIMTEAAELGYVDVRPYVKHFNPADAPHLAPEDLLKRKNKYKEHLRSIQKAALLAEDLTMIERIRDFFKANGSRTCKKPKNV